VNIKVNEKMFVAVKEGKGSWPRARHWMAWKRKKTSRKPWRPAVFLQIFAGEPATNKKEVAEK